MLVLNASKRRMVKLARAMGYEPPNDAEFSKLFRERHWWLEWYDNSGCHCLGLFSSYGRVVLSHEFSSDGVGHWHCDTVPVVLLRDCDLLIDTETC